jgi:hypothetical protein
VDSERLYRCLECLGRPVFRGKVKAHIHVAERHRHLLGRRHVDELLEQLPEQLSLDLTQEPDSPPIPPFLCLHCQAPANYRSLESIRDHLKNVHGITQPYQDHDWEDEGARHMAMVLREDAFERYVDTMRTIDTVADFLTECDA